jgi:hypothetical protein
MAGIGALIRVARIARDHTGHGPLLASAPPYLSSVLVTFGAELAPTIPEGQTLEVRFDRGEITSSDPTLYAAAGPGYDAYKECVGETWRLPVVAQIACIPVLWY